MKIASLASLAALLLLQQPPPARAAEPPAAGTTPDPFASPSGASEPTSTEDEEAAVLGPPIRPNPSAENPPPPQPPPRPAPPRRPSATAQRATQASDERSAAGEPGADQNGLAIELSTSGFASGALTGGVFVGARMASGPIVGGFVDYGMSSLGVSGATSSTSFFRLGAGLRHTLFQSADRVVDLFGAADASFESRSAEVIIGSPTPTQNVSVSGFSLALGPGVRFWVHSQIAVGYVARFRLTYLSGDGGVFQAPPTADTNSVSQTQIGFDGTFQVLGVF